MSVRRVNSRLTRGYKVLHQQVHLHVDLFARSLSGRVLLTIQPLRDIKELQLHLRQCGIQDVKVWEGTGEAETGRSMAWRVENYGDEVVEDKRVRDVGSFGVMYLASVSASNEGELVVSIPEGIVMVEEGTIGGNMSVGMTPKLYRPFTLCIRYSLVEPTAGLYYVLPNSAYPDRAPHMYTHCEIDGGRMWMPCLDTLVDRNTWEIHISTSDALTVLCSGRLVAQRNLDHSTKESIYRIDNPATARSIGFVIGQFEQVSDPYRPNLMHYCLPGQTKELQHTVGFLHQAFQYYEEYLGHKYPFEDYKQVFVDDVPTKVVSYLSLSIFSKHLLHSQEIIDQTYQSRRCLSFALAEQWFGNHITIKTWPDLWLRFGVAGYLCNLFLRKLFGNSDYQLHLVREADYVMDNAKYPLYHSAYVHQADLFAPSFRRKAPLVMYMIDKEISPEAFQKVLRKIVAPADSGEKRVSTITTRYVMQLIFKITMHEMKSFEKKWVQGIGFPDISCNFGYSRKKHLIEFALRQNVPENSARWNGEVKVRVHESDAVMTHTIAFDEDIQGLDILCHSRVRKNRRKKAKQSDPMAMTEDATEPADDARPPQTEVPLLWIRIDPEFKTIRRLHYRQSERMWANQLAQDRDILGQYEAVRGLEQHSTEAAAKALLVCVENPRIFYGVRCEAALSMAKGANRDTCHLVLQLLIKYFRQSFFDHALGRVKPNDFTSFTEYFVQQGLVRAISRIEVDKEGHTHSEALAFILALLKDNDNSQNQFSDYAYIGSMLLALGNTNTAGINDTDKILKQLDRYIAFDALSPSYHNYATAYCLRARCNLQARKTIPVDLQYFLPYIKYGFYHKVRVEAVKALVRLGLHDTDILMTLMDLIESDPSSMFRYKVAQIMARAAAISSQRELEQLIPATTATSLMNRLWHMLNGPIGGADSLLRRKLWDLYSAWWGTGIPSCAEQGTISLVDTIGADIPPVTEQTWREVLNSHVEHETHKRKRDADDTKAHLVGTKIKIPKAALPDANPKGDTPKVVIKLKLPGAHP